jgi:hypothetical protein
MKFIDYIKTENLNEHNILEEGVSDEAQKFMKNLNFRLSLLKDEIKESDKNNNWKIRLKDISNLINNIK